MVHRQVSDEDYYDALPSSGLLLAKDQAEEQFARAQTDDAYPTKDVVTDLFLINSELEAREAVQDGS